MHDGSTTGPMLPGVGVSGYDGAGNTFDRTTDSNGAMIIDGMPGTWYFSASKSGYQSVSWTNVITSSQTRNGYLTKVVTPTPSLTPATVRLTLYMHDGSTTGPMLPGVGVSGYDGAGNTFDRTTDSNGAIIIDGMPGTWYFSASKSGYQSVSWTNVITSTQIRNGYLIRL
jgi:hypothetical protein